MKVAKSVNLYPSYLPDGLKPEIVSHFADQLELVDSLTDEKASQISQRILNNMQIPLNEKEPLIDVLKRNLQFLNMFQSADEIRFIKRLIDNTPSKSVEEALPVIRLFVLITESVPYPTGPISMALEELWGDRVDLFSQFIDEALKDSLDGVSDNFINRLFDLSKDHEFVANMDQWIKDLSLMAFVDSVDGLEGLLDGIPADINPCTLEGRMKGMNYIRETLKKQSLDKYEQLVLQDFDYPNHVVQSVPEEISLFTRLKTLIVISTDIHTLPVALKTCKLLEGIQFFSASSNCYLPSEIASLPNLKVLQVKENVFLPRAFGELKAEGKVQFLDPDMYKR